MTEFERQLEIWNECRLKAIRCRHSNNAPIYKQEEREAYQKLLKLEEEERKVRANP